MYAFSLDDLKIVIAAVNHYLDTNDSKAFDKLNIIQTMLLEEVKKLYV